MKKIYTSISLMLFFAVSGFSQNAWINELHYDNTGTDVAEFIEVVIENAGDYTLSNFQIDLYNGNGGAVYNTKTLNLFTVGNTVGNFTFYYYTYPVDGLQNGAPDGMALSYQGSLINGQFLSYEGSFVGVGGSANGLTSTDIGVSETSTTPVGYSLQLSGIGTQYSAFTWQAPATETKGSLNNNQAFSTPALVISEVADPSDDPNARFVEIHNLGTYTINFATVPIYLSCQSQPAGTWTDVQLTGTVAPGNKFVIAPNTNEFTAAYNEYPDQVSSVVSGDGNDSYFLYLNGSHSNGILLDAFGVINEDGTGQPWQYENTQAVRLRSVTEPNPVWTASEWHIPYTTAVAEMTPFAHNEDVDWNGSVGYDWNTKNNWSGTYGYIPDASFNVNIPLQSNQPRIMNRDAACNTLTLESGSIVYLDVSMWFTVYGDFDVSAGDMYVYSDASGEMGSLITYGSVAGAVNFERNISDAEWHLVSSPVSDATANVFYQDFLQMYDETLPPGTNWIDIVDEEEPLVPMVGYALWGVNPIRNTTYTYTGTPNTGDQQMFVSKVNDGWNLLGNPYPSAVNWDSVELPVGINDAIYYLDAGGGYLSYVDGIPDDQELQYIPTNQGFWVKANAASFLDFTNYDRTHYGSWTYYKSQEILSDYIELEVLKDEMVDKTYIRFKGEATASFDGKYDAYKLMAANEAYPQLFTYAGSDKLSINQLPETNVIPAGFYCSESGTYTIRLAEMNDITSIKLEDLKTGTLSDLEEGDYSFSYTAGENPDRFRIHLGPTSVDTYLNNESVKIYAQGGDIIVSSANPIENSQLRLTDLSGRILLQQPVDNQSFIRLNTNLQTGIYLVTLSGINQNKTKKIIIN